MSVRRLLLSSVSVLAVLLACAALVAWVGSGPHYDSRFIWHRFGDREVWLLHSFGGCLRFYKYPDRYGGLKLPYWLVLVACAAWLIGRKAVPKLIASHRCRRARWEAANVCPACGYSLAASPTRCPECGRERTAGVK